MRMPLVSRSRGSAMQRHGVARRFKARGAYPGNPAGSRGSQTFGDVAFRHMGSSGDEIFLEPLVA